MFFYVWLRWVFVAVFRLSLGTASRSYARLSSCGAWVFVVPSMWDLSSPSRDQTHVPCIGRWSLTHWTTRKGPMYFLNNWRKYLKICQKSLNEGYKSNWLTVTYASLHSSYSFGYLFSRIRNCAGPFLAFCVDDIYLTFRSLSFHIYKLVWQCLPMCCSKDEMT